MKQNIKIIFLNNNYKILVNGKFAKYDKFLEVSLSNLEMIKAIARELEINKLENYQKLSIINLNYISLQKKKLDLKKIIEELLKYFHGDLIFYRVESPKELTDLHSFYWDPIISFMKKEFNVNFRVTNGITISPQSKIAERKIKSRIISLNSFELAGLELLVKLSGSFCISYLLFLNFLNNESAWKLSILDEMWQMEKWGKDEESLDILSKKKEDFFLVKTFLDLVKKSNH